MFNDLFRWCDDIGMFASDRPINDVGDVEGSCIHRSPYCDETCFNIKLYKLYPNMFKRDIRIEKDWQDLTPENIHENIANFFKRKENKPKEKDLTLEGNP